MESIRKIAAAPGAALPPDMLVTLRNVFLAQGSAPQARELEELFDFETGLPR